MFEEFSRGYYLGRLYVEPGEGEATLMCREQHDRISERLYEDGSGPLVVKLGSSHLAVHGGAGVPADTLSVPRDVLADAPVRNPPAFTEVLLAKAGRAAQLLRLTGGREVSDADGPAGI